MTKDLEKVVLRLSILASTAFRRAQVRKDDYKVRLGWWDKRIFDEVIEQSAECDQKVQDCDLKFQMLWLRANLYWEVGKREAASDDLRRLIAFKTGFSHLAQRYLKAIEAGKFPIDMV